MSAWYEVEVWCHESRDWLPLFAHKRADAAERKRAYVWRTGLDVRVVKVYKLGKRRIVS